MLKIPGSKSQASKILVSLTLISGVLGLVNMVSANAAGNTISGPISGPVSPTPSASPISGPINPSPSPSALSVVSFSLINAETDEVIPGYEVISNNSVISLQNLPTKKLNIRVNTNPQSVGSIRTELKRFDLNKQKQLSTRKRNENKAPYSVFGDKNGDFFKWTPKTDMEFNLKATPYSSKNWKKGTAGTPLEVVFRIVN